MRTKTISLLCVLSFAFAIPQYTSAQSLHWGIKGGLNLSSFWDNDVFDTDPKAGSVFGLFVNYPLRGNFSFQPEIQFTVKGADTKQILTDEQGRNLGEAKGDLTFYYIEIPVVIVYSFDSQTGLNPYVHAGPAISFVTRSTLETFGVQQDLHGGRNIDLGVVFGTGVSHNKFIFDIRYDLSLLSSTKSDVISYKNRVLSLSVGFLIR